MRRNHRPDNVRERLVQSMEAVGGLWLPTGPFDGWLHGRLLCSCGGGWQLCELKDPSREGQPKEFTPEQIRVMARLKERGFPFHILRSEANVFNLLGARRTA